MGTSKFDSEALEPGVIWVDCEFTGLNSREDLLLEIGAVATNGLFEVNATFSSTVAHSEHSIRQLVDKNDWWLNRSVHLTEILRDIKEGGKQLETIDRELSEFINDHVGNNAVMAGNSMYTDRLFIERDLPIVYDGLSHRVIDVSSFKEVLKRLHGGEEYAKKLTHRALDDIGESMDELKFVLEQLQK